MCIQNFLLICFGVFEDDTVSGCIDEFTFADDGAEGRSPAHTNQSHSLQPRKRQRISHRSPIEKSNIEIAHPYSPIINLQSQNHTQSTHFL